MDRVPSGLLFHICLKKKQTNRTFGLSRQEPLLLALVFGSEDGRGRRGREAAGRHFDGSLVAVGRRRFVLRHGQTQVHERLHDLFDFCLLSINGFPRPRPR